jgi:hypothetical protein
MKLIFLQALILLLTISTPIAAGPVAGAGCYALCMAFTWSCLGATGFVALHDVSLGVLTTGMHGLCHEAALGCAAKCSLVLVAPTV